MINNIIGFSQNKETLPDFFDEFTSNEKLRALFLNLSSSLVKEYYFFSKYEIKSLSKYSLEKIFEYKIKSLYSISNIKTYQVNNIFNFCLESTLIINNYVNKENKRYLFASSKLNPLAKIISTCYIKNKIELYFDKNVLFHHFVFNKIKKLHKNKRVIDNGDSICVMNENSSPLKIYTSWKKINTKDLNIKNELSNAVNSIKQTNFKQIYLVYPKLSDFYRHIDVKVDELEKSDYQIKVVPYSLRSTIRN